MAVFGTAERGNFAWPMLAPRASGYAEYTLGEFCLLPPDPPKDVVPGVIILDDRSRKSAYSLTYYADWDKNGNGSISVFDMLVRTVEDANSIGNGSIFSQRSKHFDIRYHYLREKIAWTYHHEAGAHNTAARRPVCQGTGERDLY